MLTTIVAQRRSDVKTAKRKVPLQALEAAAGDRVHHSLLEQLQRGRGTQIIAELKQASPSAGMLRRDYRPVSIAHDYAEHGAAAVSILTEPHHFLGSEEDLTGVRKAISLPILRKDFMVDAYQITESAAWGADVILLIVAALDRYQLVDLYAQAVDHRLDVLVEAHTGQELEQGLALERAILGVNSRNLKTLKTDLNVAVALSAEIPAERICIAESGIKTRDDIIRLEAEGYDGFLIGEALLSEPEPAVKLRSLLGLA